MKSYLISLILSISLGAVAQLLLKKAALLCTATQAIEKFKQLSATPFLWGGLLCYGLSLVFWLDVLSKLELSRAYPLVSLGYIASLILGYFFLQEPITVSKVIGIALIISGVYFIAR